MKFRDKKTGDVFRHVNEVCLYFCTEFSGPCYQCPIRGDYGNCHAYVLQHPEEAAKRMGMEVIDATPTGTDLLIEIRNDLTNELTEGVNMEHEDKPVTETVDHPAHYNQGGVECIDALKAATVGLEGIQAFCTANAIKYLWRWKSKGGVEDLDKAIWYINRLKEEILEVTGE